jgi:hypothetical protein
VADDSAGGYRAFITTLPVSTAGWQNLLERWRFRC